MINAPEPRYKLLHVETGGPIGGIASFIYAVAPELSPRWNSRIFSLERGEDFPVSGYDYGTQDLPPRSVRRIFSSLVRCIRSWRPDLIHLHTLDAAVHVAVARALRLWRTPHVVHLHTTNMIRSRTGLGRLLGRRSLLAAGAIMACSNEVRNRVAEFYHVPEQRIEVVPNPVSLERFESAQADTQWRERLCLGPDEMLAVFLGRLVVRSKGLDVLREAMAVLPEDVSARVMLVGPVKHEAEARALELPGRITWLGPVERDLVPSLLKACDLLVLPSRWEGLPISVIEAMAAGLPVVATRVSGIPEIVNDGESGLLVPPERPDELAAAIAWMARHPGERLEMGARGHERAQQFDAAAIARRVESAYRRALGARASGTDGPQSG